MTKRRSQSEDLELTRDAAPQSRARPLGSHADAPTEPPDRGDTSVEEETPPSSGETAVVTWLKHDEEVLRSGEATLRGMQIEFDASGRYGGASRDQTTTRERRLRRLTKQWASHDYSAALTTAERMLHSDPDDPDAARFAARCRKSLEELQLAALGGRSVIYQLPRSGRVLKALETDERTRLLATLVRQGASLGEILDVHGAARFDVLLVIARLVGAHILERS